MKNKKNYIFFGIMGLLIFFGGILINQSYALFTTNQLSKASITIKVGTMIPVVKVDGVEQNVLTVSASSSKTFTVTLENQENISGKFLLYYQDSLPSGVTFGYLEEDGMNVPRETVLSTKGKHTYSLYVKNQSSENVSISLQAIGGLSNQTLSLPSNGKYIEKVTKEITYDNQFISKVYQYDQISGSSTFCVTGEESTCIQIESQSTYPSGTIIKYKVNDTLELYFHVVSDNGDTLTLQQRENTVGPTVWNEDKEGDSSKGPVKILSVLETATSTWSNVLTIARTSRPPFTGCSSYNSCTTYHYPYSVLYNTTKARLITVQELTALGCTDTSRSCPVWVYNYLRNSKNYGGTVNHGIDYGYWTSSAWTSGTTQTFLAWYVSECAAEATSHTQYTQGGRAVVVIKK